MRHHILAVTLVVIAASTASGQGTVPSAQATAFMGTWLVEMTEPPEFKSTQTLRVWDRNGVVAASIQMGKSPARDVTGVVKDGEMLVLTIGHQAKPPVLENGAPIWVVISLTLDGETLKVAEMLERSTTIKRGTGRRSDPTAGRVARADFSAASSCPLAAPLPFAVSSAPPGE